MRNSRPALLPIALLMLATRCITHSQATHSGAPRFEGVSIIFERSGPALDPLEQRMVQSGERSASLQAGHDYWFRLQNASGHPISFSSFGTSIKGKPEWVDIGRGRVLALADDTEVAVLFRVEDRRGRPVQYSAIDVSWRSFLPSGRSIVFSVPRILVRRGRRFFVEFEVADDQKSPSYREEFAVPTVPGPN